MCRKARALPTSNQCLTRLVEFGNLHSTCLGVHANTAYCCGLSHAQGGAHPCIYKCAELNSSHQRAKRFSPPKCSSREELTPEIIVLVDGSTPHLSHIGQTRRVPPCRVQNCEGFDGLSTPTHARFSHSECLPSNMRATTLTDRLWHEV